MSAVEVREKRFFSRAAAAVYLDKSEREIDRLIRSGELLAKRDGRRVVLERKELDRYGDRLKIIDPSVIAGAGSPTDGGRS